MGVMMTGRFGASGGTMYRLFCVLLLFMAGVAMGNVVLIGRNGSLTFEDIEANFAPSIKSSGEFGIAYIADPLDACSPLSNEAVDSSNSSFALVIRGGCTFSEKVMAVQKAGFDAAIIYNNEDSDDLVAMAGSSKGIRIYAVFLTKASGETLKKFAGIPGMQLWITPSFEDSTWSIMAISFISLLSMSAVLATCFFVRNHHVRRERTRASHAPEFHGMSSQLVKAMPSLIFTTVQEDNCTSIACAICLEDYSVGDRIRILPCQHKFHASCVDAWLTSWRTFCPVCKRDARTSINIPPASECTPLLSAGSSSAALAAGLSSFHSSVAASPAIPIMPSPSQTHLSSRNHSLSSTPHILHQLRSYSNSPAMSICRSNGSSIDPRNMSSHQSYAPYLTSSNSLGLPFSSPFASRFASPHVPSSGYGSPGYLVGSSSRPSFVRNSESVTSFSALASPQSLPEC